MWMMMSSCHNGSRVLTRRPILQVDLLPEIQQPPRILSNYLQALNANNFKAEIDQYMKIREVPFLMSLHSKLTLPTQVCPLDLNYF